MKLLAIRLQNLNSLAGEMQEVRLDEAPLVTAGVFLITGPTGAGKSTLLDAITLALYGRAARYGGDRPDEMMSRHQGECLAEVDFEARGRRLRATWRLRRARGKAEGRLQPVERRLADAVSGELLAEKAGEVDRLVAEWTGLDLDRFLKSVLLAQGQFAAFLKARPNERAELLEKITGTEIYRVLSVRAYEEWKTREEVVVRLQDRLGQMEVMAEEVRASEQATLAEIGHLLSGLKAEEESLSKAVAVLKRTLEMQREQAEVAEKWAAVEAEVQAIQPRQVQAVAARQAAEVVLAGATRKRGEREPVWDEAAALTTQAEGLERQLVESRAIFDKWRLQTRAAEQKRKEVEEQWAAQVAKGKERERWLEVHADDAGLAEMVMGLREQLRVWRSRFVALKEGQRAHEQAVVLAATAQAAGAKAAEFEAVVKAVQPKLEAVRKELRVAEQKAEDLRGIVERLRQTASHDDLRAELKPGEPCSVCGAVEHPYARGSQDFVSQLATMRGVLKEAEAAVKAHDVERAKLEKEGALAVDRAQMEREKEAAARKQLAELAAPDEVALTQLRTEEAKVRLELASTPDEVELALTKLEARGQFFAKRQAESAELRRLREQVEAGLKLATQDLAVKGERLRELEEEGRARRAAADELKAKLVGLLGERSLVEDRKWYGQAEQEAGAAVKQAEAGVATLRQQEVALRTQREGLEQRLTGLKDQLNGVAEVTPERVVEQEAKLAVMKERVGEQQTLRGAVEQRLKADDAARLRRERGGVELRAAEVEAARWGRLKELIGAADGGKFSRFAQSLTLRQLTSQANEHLERLGPRYRLCAVEGDELDLQIVDLYQASEMRPMESLSGGESFLASLALALGLSELASQHHPIDSLFIDEGFGTLDAETLEVALSALENLRAQGKLIGLISHVELLKERLPTQVQVVRGSGGTSWLRVVSGGSVASW